MPHVSRKKLDKKTQDKILKIFQLILAKLKKDKEVNDFVFLLLTPTERVMLAKRLATIILINEGLSDYQISKMLNISNTTVNKFRLLLETKKAEGLKPVIFILKREKMMQTIRNSLLKLAGYASAAAFGYVRPPRLIPKS